MFRWLGRRRYGVGVCPSRWGKLRVCLGGLVLTRTPESSAFLLLRVIANDDVGCWSVWLETWIETCRICTVWHLDPWSRALVSFC